MKYLLLILLSSSVFASENVSISKDNLIDSMRQTSYLGCVAGLNLSKNENKNYLKACDSYADAIRKQLENQINKVK